MINKDVKINNDKDTTINDDRLEIIKDIVGEILNVTTFLTDEELKEKSIFVKPLFQKDGSINGGDKIENELDYLCYIHLISVEIERLGRWKKNDEEEQNNEDLISE